MASSARDARPLRAFLGGASIGAALDTDQFKNFLDHIPFAIAVAALRPHERVIYANLEFERLSGQSVVELQGRPWSDLKAIASANGDDRRLSDAITAGGDRIGRFHLVPDGAEEELIFDAWSNIIEDEHGTPMFRLVALAAVTPRTQSEDEAIEARARETDLQLRELQHRVKNNLQLITSLIRMEGYRARDDETGQCFDRLAGRVYALALLYGSMSEDTRDHCVDLGAYLSQIASAVMQAHAVEGIRLDLKVDSWPVSINVAMPTGLVVNEVLTNALKHAFVGRTGGTITLHSLVDPDGCEVSITDDGIGLPPGTTWPSPGRLSMLIVQSLRENAGAKVNVESSSESGLRVTIRFMREDAAPEMPER
ncbi:sensor histidine kinase [Elioraea sp.]|uniref:sensor histidine kinase n=1 Tax=Elioraea sp. TaxID=2185103 RepID=UPI0025B95FA2|nr:histidine kinase dimerization/phosphoacceptor domain -containing protein [Elioraea sp.]